MANVIKHKRGSGSDPGASDLILGELAIRTDTGKLFTKMDSGAIAEIAGGGSDIAINTLSSSSGTGGGSATFNGSAYRFTLSAPPNVSAAQLLVSINGVIQKPVAGTGQPSEGFSVDGTDIILGDAPATGSDFFILTFKSLGVSEPADNSVTTAKIADDAVDHTKLATGAANTAAIGNEAVTTAKIFDGAITNAKVNASAAIAGTKISPDFGSQNITTSGEIEITGSNTVLKFTENDANPDFGFLGNAGSLRVQDLTNTANLFIFEQNRVRSIKNFDAEAGIDVTGAITGTGDLTIDTNTLKVDSTNNRVGIGTATPSTTLNVTGTAAQAGIFQSNQSATTISVLDTDGDGLNISGGSTYGHRIHTNNTENLELGVNNSTKLLINSSGFVGIGTTSPAQLLEIHGASNPAILLKDTTNNVLSYLYSQDLVGAVGTASNHPFVFNVNNGEKMRIDTSGNVGIGTTSPAAGLTIAKQGTIISGTGNNYAFHINLLSSGYVYLDNVTGAGNNTSMALRTYNNGTYTQFIQSISGNETTFETAGSERMRINSSGNVGIGTTSPTGKFAVSDGTTEGEINPNGGICYIGTRSNHPVTLLTNATGRMTIDTSGNVGINSDGSGPDRLLHVSDSNNGGAVTPFRLTNINGSSGTEVRMEFECGVDEIAYIGAKNEGSDIGPLIFATATSQAAYPTEKMRIGSNGAINAQGVYDQTTSSGANLNVASDGHIRRSTSSRRYKNTITDATHGLTELLKLKSVTFKGNEDGDTVFGGLIAEDVHNAGLTEFVHYDKDNEPDALAYGNMVALCVKAIQDLNAKVEALEAK